MIIHKTTNQVQTMSTHPNDNWMGEEWALVPPELHERAWELAPYCIPEFDGDGNLIDIQDSGGRPPEPGPEPTADELLSLILGVDNDE
ncbi:MAG: hypothetical protein GX823_05880 [Clostridiales bacterium]|nr:hypothetical protein [Clostridiales bacterium]